MFLTLHYQLAGQKCSYFAKRWVSDSVAPDLYSFEDLGYWQLLAVLDSANYFTLGLQGACFASLDEFKRDFISRKFVVCDEPEIVSLCLRHHWFTAPNNCVAI